VANYDRVQEHQDRVLAQLQADRARLVADRLVEDKAVATLRTAAVASYMSGASSNTQLSLFEPTPTFTTAAEEEYATIASRRLSHAIDIVRLDEQQTSDAVARLRLAQAVAASSSGELGQARDAAQLAVQRDILLAQVEGNYSSLLGSASQQDDAARRAQEQDLATIVASAPPTDHPVHPTHNPRPDRYLDPLRDIRTLRPSRIDMGVDYTGYGPIYAIAAGVVLSTVSSGWPGGTFVSYRLTAGRASGLVAYVAEDLVPLVTIGQEVTPQTVLGTMYEGPSGIETGWADPAGNGNTMAGLARQFGGSNSAAFGINFSQLMASLGAPPGVMQSGPPVGVLPPDWPSW
jgi:murein DD-endopeptidase MepM/ murein hydrolase activator NlpD